MGRFISAQILERLQAGTFVPERRQRRQAARGGKSDRRQLTTPLTLTKRCVPYTAAVFTDRTQRIMTLAYTLNQPSTRVMAITGKPAVGKTALVRALVEMMGGGPEQVLWVDGDFVRAEATMATVLIDTLRELANRHQMSASVTAMDAETSATPVDNADPMQLLHHQLARLSDVPVLVVLDHVEQLLTEHQQFHSPITQELLSFLLTLPNITLMLVGQQLPSALGRLLPKGASAAGRGAGGVDADSLVEVSLSLLESGEAAGQHPLWLHTAQHLGVAVDEVATQLPERLTALDLLLATALLAVSHPLTLPQWRQLCQVLAKAYTTSGNAEAFSALGSDERFMAFLKQSPLKPLLKRSLSPQAVLSVWQQAAFAGHPHFKPEPTWYYSLYAPAARLLKEDAPPALLRRAHQWLAQWYLGQRQVTQEERWLPVPNSQLVHEARAHLKQAEALKQAAKAAEDIDFSFEEAALQAERDQTDADGAFHQRYTGHPDIGHPDVEHTGHVNPDSTRPPAAIPNITLSPQIMPHITMVTPSSSPLNPTYPASESVEQSIQQTAVSPPEHGEETQSHPDFSEEHPGTQKPSPQSEFARPVSVDTVAPLSAAHVAYESKIQMARQAIRAGNWGDAKAQLHALLAQLQHVQAVTEETLYWWQAVVHYQLARVALAEWHILEARTQHAQAGQQGAVLPEVPQTIPLATIQPFRVKLALQHAELAHHEGHPAQALAACESVTSVVANTPHLLPRWAFARAKALDELGDRPAALQAYDAAIAASEGSSSLEAQPHYGVIAAYINKACLLMEEARYAEATQALRRAIALETAKEGQPEVETLRLLAQSQAPVSLNEATTTLNEALHLAVQAQRLDWQVGILAEQASWVSPQQAQQYLEKALHLLDNTEPAPWVEAWRLQLKERLYSL